MAADSEAAQPSSGPESMDSDFTSEHEESSSSYASASRDLRPPPLKKGKLGTGKFKSSWRLTPHITFSFK